MPNRAKHAVMLALFSGLAYAPSSQAQYYDTQVLEKSFEVSDLFFSPHFVNPYGIAGFGQVASGLISHPLLNVRLNPSFMVADSFGTHYGYVDFRRSRSETEFETPCCFYADLAVRDAYAPTIWPGPYFAPPRADVEPLFSVGYFGRPFAEHASSTTVGATYQVLFRDEDFYAVPADIYRSRAESDFSGNLVTTDSSPIVDRSTGQNSMRTAGHLGALYAGARIGLVDVGGRFGLSLFDKNGSIGNDNRWTSTQTVDNSFWSNLESRDQYYRHVDGELGASVSPTPGVRIGATFGVLSGSAEQNLTRTDTSYYRSRQDVASSYFSTYERGGRTAQSWDHDGNTVWFGGNVVLGVGHRQSLSVNYRHQRQNADLILLSQVSDTSFSNYHSGFDRISESTSVLFDRRSGNGTDHRTESHASAIMTWKLDRRSLLNVGVNVRSSLQTTETQEHVHARRSYDWLYQSDQYVQESLYGAREEKDLLWAFESRRTHIAVPLYLTTEISDHLTLELGINRRIVLWRLSDETTALFDFLEEIDGDVVTLRENFGERFQTPETRKSEVLTTALLGVTIRPDAKFAIRALAAPEHRRDYFDQSDYNIQWWIAFTFGSQR